MGLTESAREILEAARESKDGIVTNAPTFGKMVNIRVGGEGFPQDHDPRSEAVYKSALDDLLHYGLIEDRTGKGQVFHLTAYGYQYADVAPEPPKRPIGFKTPHTEDG